MMVIQSQKEKQGRKTYNKKQQKGLEVWYDFCLKGHEIQEGFLTGKERI